MDLGTERVHSTDHSSTSQKRSAAPLAHTTSRTVREPCVFRRPREMSATDVISLVITALQAMKQIHDDVHLNSASCKELAAHCEVLAFPVNQINEHKDDRKGLIAANSSALQNALTLLTECRNFCDKYRGRKFMKLIMQSGKDKDTFTQLHRRLDSAAIAFTMQLASDMAIAAHEREQAAKAQRDHANALLMQLLQAQGKEKEFMSLPPEKRREYLDRARMTSDNLRDLSELDLTDSSAASTPSRGRSAAAGSSMNTKMSILNTLIEDIDFARLKHWNPKAPDHTRVLGKGSFGSVYRVEYEGKEVALKHFACLADPHVKPTERDIRKIKREACILQYCAEHKNVIGFFGVDMKAGIMLMELAVCSLNAVLYGRASLFPTLPKDVDREYLTSFPFKASVLQDVASALHFLHFHNIIHRDIKSPNIIMVVVPAAAGRPVTLAPKLSDFGLAKAAGDATKTSASKDSVVGTIPYSSPEILNGEGGEPVYTTAVDIYALGILANEMFTEKVPWHGIMDGAIIGKVCYQSQRPELYVPPPGAVLEKQVMDEIVGNARTGCLAQDPAKRPTAKFLSFESDLLRRASSKFPSYSPHTAQAHAQNFDCAAQESFRPTAHEEKRFREAFMDAQQTRRNEKAAFFEELTTLFKGEKMQNFEVFATDAAEVLKTMYHSNGEEDFVANVMAPMHRSASTYVTKKLKDEIYIAEPQLLFQELDRLSEQDIRRLMLDMGSMINEMHTHMISATEDGQIADHEHSLRAPQLLRILLRCYALAALCEPKCCFMPEPGERIPFQKGYDEIFSPGLKLHGPINPGDIVQVVCPGLFIEAPSQGTTLSTQPLAQVRVRRLTLGHGRPSSRSFMVSVTDLRKDFNEAFSDFESFACDAIECLQELRIDSAADVFVTIVMSAIYQSTLRWVTETRSGPNKAMYDTQPQLILLDIQDLSDEDIMLMMDRLGPKVKQLHTAMVNAGARGTIADEPNSLRIPKLIRLFLKLHAQALLSNPKVALEPLPGYRMPFRSSHCAEILSPGVKMYGRIKEGDLVEVVLCGVQAQTEGDSRPSIPPLVRRIMPKGTEQASTTEAAEIAISQADVKAEFAAAFGDFESFCCDAVDCLEEMPGYKDVGAFTLVNKVLLPMYNIAKKYVTDRVAKKMLKVADIVALEASNIDTLMNEAEPLLMRLHFKMLDCAEEGFIDNKPDRIRLPDLMRIMLRLHTVAALSSPKCFLLPAPGYRGTYTPNQHTEIMSPGAKTHGRINESSPIEVVLPGLYFQPPGSAGAVPIVPTLVRRIVGKEGGSSK